MSIIKVGIIQSSFDQRNLDLNVRRTIDLVSTLSNPDIAVLPENWLGRKPISLKEYLEITNNILETSKSKILVSGSSYVKINGSIYSKTIIIDNRGRYVVGDKLFPSNATGERNRISAGTSPAYYSHYPGIGSIICVDLIYPEVARYLALRGANIIVNPSFIPSNRSYLWRSIASARAAENTIYIIHVNATGMRYLDGRSVNGGSFIVDPEGRIIFEMDSSIGIDEFNIELNSIYRIRQRWRYLNDISSRPEIIDKIKRLISEERL